MIKPPPHSARLARLMKNDGSLSMEAVLVEGSVTGTRFPEPPVGTWVGWIIQGAYGVWSMFEEPVTIISGTPYLDVELVENG